MNKKISREQVKSYERKKADKILQYKGKRMEICDSTGRFLGRRVIRQNEKKEPYVILYGKERIVGEIIQISGKGPQALLA